ncbi:PGPGW domain-containing protein [Candidatus Saccharibacteria bacterium]|nr:PGPGW domain-containing protein [Candidatus Saccharibacteria bacterium]
MKLLKQIWKRLRQTAVFIVGFLLVIFGLVLIPLPFPGTPFIFLGLVVLASEFAWAEKHVERVKRLTHRGKVKPKAAKPPQD